MKYVVLVLALAVLFVPSSKNPVTPKPDDPIVNPVKQDVFDVCHDSYRGLMVDVWSEYSQKRPSFKNDEEALNWLNTHQVAAWTAAYEPFTKRAAIEAAADGNPKSLADDLKAHKL
jgi:hypothetical protein